MGFDNIKLDDVVNRLHSVLAGINPSNIVDILSKSLSSKKKNKFVAYMAEHADTIENSSDIFYRLDEKGSLVYINTGGLNHLGFEKTDNLFGKPFTEYIHPEDRERVIRSFNTATENKEEHTKKLEYRIFDSLRKVIWVESNATKSYDRKGRYKGESGVLRDITERKKLEDMLKRSEEENRLLYERAPTGIYRIDFGTGKILRANNAVCEYYGCSQSEIGTLNPFELLTQESKKLFLERLNKMSLGEIVSESAEYTIINRRGERMDVQLNSKFIHDEKGVVTGADVVIHDITERKKIENELANLAAIVSSSEDAIIRMDLDGKVEYINDATERLYGLRKEEVLGRYLEDLIVPDNRKGEIRGYLEEIKAGRNVPKYLTKRKRRYISGTEVTEEELDVSINISKVLDSSGKIVGAASITSNITKLKQMEKALEDEHMLLRNLIDNVPDRIYAKDTKSRITICNEAMARRMGKTSPDELIGKSDFDLLPMDLAKKFYADDQIVMSGQPMINREEPLETIDGKITRWSLATKIPMQDKSGKIIGYVGIGKEITERKHAEEMIRKSEERLRDIIFSMSDWVWETDIYGVYTYSSQKGSTYLGRTIEEIIGKTPFDFMPEEEAKRVAVIFSEIVAKKLPIKDLENWNIDKNGERICLLTNGVPILDEEGNIIGYRGVDKDITERKRLEEKLMEAATTDPLTGLYNRRMGLEYLENQIEQARRNNLPLTVGFLDMNGFKEINDVYGHQEGDFALKYVADAFRKVMRKSDIPVRTGGDEFLLIMPNCDIETAKSDIEDRLKVKLKDYKISTGEKIGKDLPLSSSYGFYRYNPEENLSVDDFIKRADELMYQHKRDSKTKRDNSPA
jgi:diguanylate cyclase (GGDEF)-like protein/PAS domain S-box-containing protein